MSLKILQLSDTHLFAQAGETLLGVDTEYYFLRTLQQAHDQHGGFDLIVISGDLAQQPGRATYQRLKDHLRPFATPCWWLPGNHDDFELMHECCDEPWIGCDSHRLLAGWSIIALNSQKPKSPAGRLTDAELLKLENLLVAHRQLPTLLMMHHPCFATGSAWLDSMQIENSAELLAIIERHPQLQLMVCGHIHQQFSGQHGHVTLLGSPATCFQFTPGSLEFSVDATPPGYRLIELQADGQWRSHCQHIAEALIGLNHQAHNY